MQRRHRGRAAAPSTQAYRDVRDYMAPYKCVLDVYTSRWFGNISSKNKQGTPLDPTDIGIGVAYNKRNGVRGGEPR